MADRTVGEELRQAARDSAQRVLQRRQACAAAHGGRTSGRPGRAPETDRARSRRRAAVRSSAASPSRVRDEPELRQDERDVRLLPGQPGEDPQRLIQRLFDKPRHLRLVGHLEPGIDVRLERKLAQQRQAERIDRADGDLAEPIAQLAPARLDRRRSAPRRPAAPR